MASVDELSASVAATKDAIEQSTSVVAAAMQQAEELSGQLAAMGVESKSSQAMQVKDSLEQMQAQLAALQSATEQIQAQAEALRGLQGDTGGRVSVGDAIGGKEVPTPAGATGDKDGPPPTEPPTPAANNFEPEDFDFDLFGDDEPSNDKIVYTISEAPPAPDEIDTEELTGRSRFDKMRQGLARNLGDAKEAIERANYDASDLVSDDYDPYSNTSAESLVPSGPDPVAQAERPPGDSPSAGTLVGSVLAVTVFGVEVAGKIKDAVNGKRG